MAATYGYGGEFSSDEDIDRMEQQQSTEYGSYNQASKPTKSQIDQAIEAIRSLPIEEDVRISDDLLAGLLDHFKTQRGPIVDSTRNLYKKIILRLIRGEQQQSNGDSNNLIANTNGNTNMQATNDIIINNNNDVSLLNKKPIVEIPSSDEDEPMPPASQEQAIKNFDSRVVYDNNNINHDDDDDDKLVQPMEIDSENQPLGAIRGSKQVDMPTDEDDSETDESNKSSSEEELDITPTKIEAITQKTSTPIVNFKKTAKRADLAALKKASSSSLKEPITELKDDVKKPYRRSQRVAASRSSTSPPIKSLTDSGNNKVLTSADVATVGMKTRSKSALSSKFNMKYFISIVIVAILAFFIYYFKNDIMSSTQRFMKKVDIKF